MPRKGANISLSSYDDIFEIDESRADSQLEKVQFGVLFPQTDAGYHYQAPRTVAAKAPAGPGTLSINVLLPDINRKPP